VPCKLGHTPQLNAKKQVLGLESTASSRYSRVPRFFCRSYGFTLKFTWNFGIFLTFGKVRIRTARGQGPNLRSRVTLHTLTLVHNISGPGLGLPYTKYNIANWAENPFPIAKLSNERLFQSYAYVAGGPNPGTSAR